ncbi:hypothetical protein BH10PSE11_BH10PSE11_03110 [soil metagenome]
MSVPTIGRARYWSLTALCVLAVFVALWLILINVNKTSSGPVDTLAAAETIAGILIFFFACVMLFVVGVRRLRDRGKSGFWIIPYYVAPAIFGFLSIDPEGTGTVAGFIALAILGWVAFDLGITETAKPA